MRFKILPASCPPWQKILPLLIVACALVRLASFGYDHRIFQKTAIASAALAFVLMWRMPAPQWRQWIAPPGPRPVSHSWHFLGAGAALIVATLTFLEWRQPYYFTQEDTHTLFFPLMLQAARGLFGAGIFPTWNGYTLMGAPSTTLGFYALTYPPLYLCYGLARYVLGNEFLTVDIMAWLHLLGGYAITFALLRRLNVRPAIAAAVALGFALQGFNLIAGRSWYYMLPTALYFPAMCLSLVVFMQRSLSTSWVIGTALVIGLYFHSGNIQMWSYAVLLYSLGMLWVLALKPKSASDMPRILLAATLAILIALPLAIPQFLQTKDLPRSPLNVTIGHGLSNMLLPWPFAMSPPSWRDYDYSGTLFFSGGVFILLFFLKCALDLAATGKRQMRRQDYLLACFPLLAMLAFAIGMGHQGYVWNLLGKIPPFSKFRMPFRILPFITLLMLTTGALMAEIALRNRNGAYREYVLAGLAVFLSIYSAYHATATFDYCPDKPYLPLPKVMERFQAKGFSTRERIYPIVNDRWYTPGSTLTQLLNYPAIYQIPVITGSYSSSPDSTTPEHLKSVALFFSNREEFFREYSVKWVLIPKFKNIPIVIPPEEVKKYEKNSRQTISTPVANMYYVGSKQTKPMAYTQTDPFAALPYRIRPDGVDIRLRHVRRVAHQTVTANFLYFPWFKAYTDTSGPLPIYPDEHGRITVELANNDPMLYLRFAPPFYIGLYAWLTAFLIWLVCMRPKIVALYRQWYTRPNPDEHANAWTDIADPEAFEHSGKFWN